jgi:Glycosyl hydrolase family 1
VNVDPFGSDNQIVRSDDKQMTKKNKRQSHFVVGTKQSITVVQVKMKIILLTVALAVSLSQSALVDETLLYGEFPPNFIWAAATASYQVEGGWNAGGQLPLFSTSSATSRCP